MLSLLVALTIGQTPLEVAQAACEKSLEACKERDRLEAEARAANDARSERNYRARRAESEALQAKAAAEAEESERKIEALKKKCGSDFGRVRVGMRFARVRECSPEPFEMVGEDTGGQVWRNSGGTLRTESGKVTRWISL